MTLKGSLHHPKQDVKRLGWRVMHWPSYKFQTIFMGVPDYPEWLQKSVRGSVAQR